MAAEVDEAELARQIEQCENFPRAGHLLMPSWQPSSEHLQLQSLNVGITAGRNSVRKIQASIEIDSTYSR
jgi:hypothetical protein